jgi:hypothetical protein
LEFQHSEIPPLQQICIQVAKTQVDILGEEDGKARKQETQQQSILSSQKCDQTISHPSFSSQLSSCYFWPFPCYQPSPEQPSSLPPLQPLPSAPLAPFHAVLQVLSTGEHEYRSHRVQETFPHFDIFFSFGALGGRTVGGGGRGSGTTAAANAAGVASAAALASKSSR